MAPAQFLLQGSIGRLVTTVLLLASALAISRGRLASRWLAGCAVAIAAVQLAFVPSLFFGAEASNFYSAVGWGGTAVAPGLLVTWILLLSLSLLRMRQPMTPTLLQEA